MIDNFLKSLTIPLLVLFCSIAAVSQTSLVYDMNGNRINIKKAGNLPKPPAVSGKQDIHFSYGKKVTESYTAVSTNPLGSSFRWSVLGGNILEGQGQNHVRIEWNKPELVSGSVFVIEKTTQGCEIQSDKLVVTFGLITGITPEEGFEKSIIVYPNPVIKDIMVTFTLNEDSPVTLLIANLLGQIMKQYELGVQKSGQHSKKISDLDNLGAGTYQVVIKTKSSYTSQKFVIY